jgi:hypothetical protein
MGFPGKPARAGLFSRGSRKGYQTATEAKAVAYCPCDGVDSSRCPLWPYRFGVRPETAAAKHGRQSVMPKEMPPSEVNLDELPAKVRATKPEPVGV